MLKYLFLGIAQYKNSLFIGDRNYKYHLLPIFIIDEKTKFQFKFSENEDHTPSPSQLLNSLNFIEGLLGYPWVPGWNLCSRATRVQRTVLKSWVS